MMLCTVVRVAAVMSDILFIAAMIAWPRETEVTGNYVDMVIYLNSAAGETAGCSCFFFNNVLLIIFRRWEYVSTFTVRIKNFFTGVLI